MGDIAIKGNRLTAAKGGRASLRFGGGRTDLLEELGRVEGERSNPNRRAEISRVHSELNRGYAKGGRAGYKFGSSRHALKRIVKRLKERHEKKRLSTEERGLRTTGLGAAEGGRIGFKKGTDKKWMQKVSASIKKRGTKGKCTPITKPGCTGRAKALAKTFKKMARERKSA